MYESQRRGSVAIVLLVVALFLGTLGSLAGYIMAVRLLRASPPRLAYVNVTGAVAQGGRLVVMLNVSAARGVRVLGGYVGLSYYGLSAPIGPGSGRLNASLPLIPQLLEQRFVYVAGYINITYEGARGYVTFSKLVPLSVIISLRLVNVSWSYRPPEIILLLNYSFPYNATVNVTGELVSTSAQPPVGVIALGPLCWGVLTLPPGSGTVAVNLTHCSIVIPLTGRYMASWYFAGGANVTFQTPTGPLAESYTLYLYHRGAGT